MFFVRRPEGIEKPLLARCRQGTFSRGSTLIAAFYAAAHSDGNGVGRACSQASPGRSSILLQQDARSKRIPLCDEAGNVLFPFLDFSTIIPQSADFVKRKIKQSDRNGMGEPEQVMDTDIEVVTQETDEQQPVQDNSKQKRDQERQ